MSGGIKGAARTTGCLVLDPVTLYVTAVAKDQNGKISKPGGGFRLFGVKHVRVMATQRADARLLKPMTRLVSNVASVVLVASEMKGSMENG